MIPRLGLYVIGANLAVLALLCFAYPELMIAPGPLMAAHAKLNTDCFACHDAFRGASAEKCIACHKVDDIGRLSTTGAPLSADKRHVPFHRNLLSRDCIACHADHLGVTTYRPKGRFSHDLLPVATRDRCQDCHRKPADSLHAKISGNCRQCHLQDKWKPASFAHDDYFVLDRDHDAECATCHAGNDFRRYTCYGCHEHTPANIRDEHAEEGIANLDDCADCHSSGEGEGRRRGGGGDD